MNGTLRGFAVMVLCMLVIAGAACSRSVAPSDEEILKAIDDSGILKSAGFKLTAPVVILEKGPRDANGVWPVRVKLTMNAVGLNGQTRQLETTPVIRIIPRKDDHGKTVWRASL